MDLQDESLHAFVCRDDEIAIRLREDSASGYGRFEVPVAAVWIQTDDFSLGIDAVDIAAIRRGKRREFRFRRLDDVSLPQVQPSGEPLCVDERNSTGIGIECQHPIERRRFIDKPDCRVEFWIDVNAACSSAARNAKEKRFGPVSFCYWCT